MSAKSNPHFVPPIDKSLLKRLHAPDSWILGRTTEHIDWFNKVLNSIPRNYTWEFMSAEAFEQNFWRLVSPHGADSDPGPTTLPVAPSDAEATRIMNASYRHYWRDMLGQIEAFSVMSAWRLAEIARSAVWAIRRGDVVCAAILSRAALETAAAYEWLNVEVRPGLETIGQADAPTFWRYKEGDIEKTLESKLLKVIFASTSEDDPEKLYQPTRIGKLIQRIAELQSPTQTRDQQIVADTYFRLCEVVHPNWAGRSVYVTSVEPGRIPGHEKRTISNNHGAAEVEILRDAVSALSWSTGAFSGCCVELQKAIGGMRDHLSRVSY